MFFFWHWANTRKPQPFARKEAAVTLILCAKNAGTNHPFYFWRDRQGNEVDLLVDHGSHLQPIEIKSSQTMNPDYLKGLKKWMSLAQDQGNSPALVYGGD
ncbi:MAG: DUF4143 domain-containing protein, partial [SAR324 cluster bacterium]|nr:DUF4143 domain-containing protein [SAR324 cluster bacterium]